MKQIITDNHALIEVLENNGISVLCDSQMRMVISDADADSVEDIVAREAPAAISDYTIEDITASTMTIDQAIARFGKDLINQLIDMQAEPTNRLIDPVSEPQHAGMDEYCAGSVYVDGGKIDAYYYQPAHAEDWEYGEMNGIQYGDIEYIEFTEC